MDIPPPWCLPGLLARNDQCINQETKRQLCCRVYSVEVVGFASVRAHVCLLCFFVFCVFFAYQFRCSSARVLGLVKCVSRRDRIMVFVFAHAAFAVPVNRVSFVVKSRFLLFRSCWGLPLFQSHHQILVWPGLVWRLSGRVSGSSRGLVRMAEICFVLLLLWLRIRFTRLLRTKGQTRVRLGHVWAWLLGASLENMVRVA